MRERALVLSPEAPYPLHGGGALRTASLVSYLSRDFDVDLIVFRQPGEPDPGVALPPGLVRSLNVVRLAHHPKNGPARIWRNGWRFVRGVPPLVDRFSGYDEQIRAIVRGHHYAWGLIEHFWCAPYWPIFSSCCERTILDLHNIESVLHEACAGSEPWVVASGHRRFGNVCAQLEKEWLPKFSLLLSTSDEDAARIRRISPASQVVVYPNALPFTEIPALPEEQIIAFSGNLEYHPNQAAVRYFAEEIWPELRERFPQLRWRLIGKNAHAIARYVVNDSRIELTGPVEDATAELAAAQVVVVPLLAGSGTRFKILEAWAAARPVVSTSIGAEGLPARDGDNILIADTPSDFVRAVAHLLSSPGICRKIGAAGRLDFATRFTWESAWTSLDRWDLSRKDRLP